MCRHGRRCLASARAFEEIDALRIEAGTGERVPARGVTNAGAFANWSVRARLEAVTRRFDLVRLTEATVLIRAESGTGRTRRPLRFTIAANGPEIPDLRQLRRRAAELTRSSFLRHVRRVHRSVARPLLRSSCGQPARSFSTRWAKSRSIFKPNCCACCGGALETRGHERYAKVNVRLVAATKTATAQ